MPPPCVCEVCPMRAKKYVIEFIWPNVGPRGTKLRVRFRRPDNSIWLAHYRFVCNECRMYEQGYTINRVVAVRPPQVDSSPAII